MNIAMHAICLPVALAAAGLLAGCSTHLSRGIDDQGRAEEVVFPDIAADATLPEGIFPNLDNLREVAPGMTKDQLYALLGRPHFQEGLLGVREWDYVFNFRSGGGTTVCQYKLIFDKAYLAQSFHWKPAQCRALLAGPALVEPVKAAGAPRFRLASDTLFPFDSAVLQPEGRREVARLAAELKKTAYERVELIGHTDRLGAEGYNQQLSQRRADAVRAALAEAGVAAERIVAQGRGDREPEVQCHQRDHAVLVSCLAPNRRVDVRVHAAR
ncbi:OmpA family protein [Xenophilus sp.]|jgi:outer membrane protein OmpA-like peptidoglycan-associated protein|uniref:OmpA family protein n=1 Tax=Xenophilus sp. TaxID=1873499 RepID=UPI0037DD0657